MRGARYSAVDRSGEAYLQERNFRSIVSTLETTESTL